MCIYTFRHGPWFSIYVFRFMCVHGCVCLRVRGVTEPSWERLSHSYLEPPRTSCQSKVTVDSSSWPGPSVSLVHRLKVPLIITFSLGTHGDPWIVVHVLRGSSIGSPVLRLVEGWGRRKPFTPSWTRPLALTSSSPPLLLSVIRRLCKTRGTSS